MATRKNFQPYGKRPTDKRGAPAVSSVKTRKSLYRRLKDVWQLLPPTWNARIRQAPVSAKIIDVIARATAKAASHQEVYDKRYTDYLDVEANKYVPVMAATIRRLFEPKSVIDVGCGAGNLLAQLKQDGLEVRGLEYSDTNIARCREKSVPVDKLDLETGGTVNGTSDITISFEVAEHLPEPAADNYVRIITQFSPIVVMSAATVGQGGLDHVNEQPHEYWIEKMNVSGFDYDKEISQQVRSEWKQKGVAYWYTNNIMIFRKQTPQKLAKTSW
jgi:SAM-dependent methyltransferase